MTSIRRLARLAVLGGLVQGCNCGPGTTPSPVGTWKYRYNCSSDTPSQCFDADQCGSETLSADAADTGAFKNAGGTLSGTLTGTVFKWKARWGSPPYDEVGTWTFSSDFSSFTQATCYTYDGTADLATTTCTGQNRGQCTGTGSKGNPGPPAAVGACPVGASSSNCN